VLSAIRESGSVGRVILIAGFDADADTILKPGASFLDNVMAGVEAAREAETLMVTASDIPLATGEAFPTSCIPSLTKQTVTPNTPPFAGRTIGSVREHLPAETRYS